MSCEHEFENANCTNCANGLPTSAYECAKTKGKLKEYCHERAENIRKAEYEKGYEKGREDAINECLSIVEHELKDTAQPRYDWCTLWRSLWKKFEALKERNDGR